VMLYAAWFLSSLVVVWRQSLLFFFLFHLKFSSVIIFLRIFSSGCVIHNGMFHMFGDMCLVYIHTTLHPSMDTSFIVILAA
jgi:hypothetical protein